MLLAGLLVFFSLLLALTNPFVRSFTFDLSGSLAGIAYDVVQGSSEISISAWEMSTTLPARVEQSDAGIQIGVRVPRVA